MSVLWLSARLQYLQCVSTGVTAVLRWTIKLVIFHSHGINLYQVDCLWHKFPYSGSVAKHCSWGLEQPALFIMPMAVYYREQGSATKQRLFSRCKESHYKDKTVMRPSYYYTPASTKLKGGVYWFHLVCPFVRLSVCGQNSVRSVSSTIFVRSIAYLHILLSNFRRCVVCKVCFKIRKFVILANSLNL